MKEIPAWISALTGVLTFVTAVCGLWFVTRQLREVDRNIQSNTQAQLVGQSYEIIDFIANEPSIYDYFYNGKDVPAGGKYDVKVMLCAEMLANYLENLVLQKQNISTEMWAAWESFIMDSYQRSPALRFYLERHKTWYSPQLIQLVSVKSTTPQ